VPARSGVDRSGAANAGRWRSGWPVEVADRPTAEAQRTDRSVIDRAAELIVDHLRITIAHTDRKSAQMQQRMTTAAEPLVLARPTAGVDTV